MTAPKTGFSAVYSTHRALEADHSAYMTHGGLIVRCTAEEAPAPNTAMVLRIESPSGRRFDLDARAGHYLKKKGFMVSFEDAKEVREKLDQFVVSEAFKSALALEPGEIEAPTFSCFDPSDDPGGGTAPFDDATPIDSGLPNPVREALRNEAHSNTALHPSIDEVPNRKPRRKAPASANQRSAAKGETTIRKPESGTEYPVYAVKYPTVADFMEVCEELGKIGVVHLPFVEESSTVNDVALFRIILPGRNQFEVFGVIEAVSASTVTLRMPPENETLRKAVLYPTTIAARKRRENELPEHRGPPVIVRIVDQAPDEDLEKMPIRRRLSRMGMDDKINMALSGNREERMALAMDGNRAVHHYLLKNAKITLDEIAFMSRIPSLNPDVLEKIAENPMYTQNPTVTKALVYNPKTPIRTAIRLLDRLPRPEVMNLAKRSNMNLRLVMAAKKKIERFKG